MEKADLSKGYQNPETKLGVTKHFSKTIEVNIWKEMSILSLYFKAFIMVAYLSLKNAWLPTFFFFDSNRSF